MLHMYFHLSHFQFQKIGPFSIFIKECVVEMEKKTQIYVWLTKTPKPTLKPKMKSCIIVFLNYWNFSSKANICKYKMNMFLLMLEFL
jgi:hypothetical protein